MILIEYVLIELVIRGYTDHTNVVLENLDGFSHVPAFKVRIFVKLLYIYSFEIN